MTNALPNNFYWKNYLYKHPDLQLAFGNSQEDIEKHYLEHGFYEHRPYESDISLIICCMNRSDHLYEVINSWNKSNLIAEIILVDYSSTIPISTIPALETLQKDNLKIIRVDNEQYFNLGKAYNLAIDFTTKKIIIKIDADYILKSDEWIKYLYRKNFSQYYLCCDYTLFNDNTTSAKGLSGFWAMTRNNFPYYREDLFGYGYDDIDLINRLDDADLKPILFFDIENYIHHIDHDDDTRTQNYIDKNYTESGKNNEILCQFNNTNINRHKYTISPNNIYHIQYTSLKKLNNIYCINLASKTDRWDRFKDIEYINRIEAVNNSNDMIFNLCPSGLTAYIYFTLYPNAWYTYMSHYNAWKKVLAEDAEYTMILEDDVDLQSVHNLYHYGNIDISLYDYIQLSNRVSVYDDRFIFDGGEAYILNKKMAQTLIDVTHYPNALRDIIPHEYDKITDFFLKNNDCKNYIQWKNNSICAPVDKFMGYCCESKYLNIKSYIYPAIKLDVAASKNSSIELSGSDIFKYLHDNTIKYYYDQMIMLNGMGRT